MPKIEPTIPGAAIDDDDLIPAEAPESLDERLVAAEALLAEAQNERLRALAELDNARKRLTREKDEAVKYAAEAVLADLLPVIDNLELAINHGQNVPGCKDVLLGVEMTRRIFLETLAKHGLEAVAPAAGEAFNPESHEAIGFAPGAAPGSVAQLAQTGYRLKGRLVRPAKVLVGSE